MRILAGIALAVTAWASVGLGAVAETDGEPRQLPARPLVQSPGKSSAQAAKSTGQPEVKAAPQETPKAPAGKDGSKKNDTEIPMEVVLVRDTGACSPNCAQWISAEGRIDASTPDRFRTILKQNPSISPLVVLHSGGGSVTAAVEIGRLIRTRKLDVVVGRTAIDPCQPNDRSCSQQRAKGLATGTNSPTQAVCLSACPLILAGGVHRYVGRRAAVGVHEITQHLTYRLVERRFRYEKPSLFAPAEKKLVSEKVIETKNELKPADNKRYAELAVYLGDMGVSAEVVSLMKQTPRNSIRVLGVAQLREYGLITGISSAADLLSPVRQPMSVFEAFGKPQLDPSTGLPSTAPTVPPTGAPIVATPGVAVSPSVTPPRPDDAAPQAAPDTKAVQPKP